MNATASQVPASRREWSNNGRDFARAGSYYCLTPGAAHVFVEMGRDGEGRRIEVCDVCGVWSRRVLA